MSALSRTGGVLLRIGRWVLGGLLALLTFVIILLLALALALSQPESRVWLAERGAALANDYTDWQIELSDVESPGLTHWIIGDLKVSRTESAEAGVESTTDPAQHELLTASGFELNFLWSEALDEKYIVEALAANSIWINSDGAAWGGSESEEAEVAEEDEATDLKGQVNQLIDQLFEVDSSGLPHVVVNRLAIDRIEMTDDFLQGDALSPEQRAEIPLVWEIRGEASLPEARAELAIQAIGIEVQDDVADAAGTGANLPGISAKLEAIAQETGPAMKQLSLQTSQIPPALLNQWLPVKLTRQPELRLLARTAGTEHDSQRIEIETLQLKVEDGLVGTSATVGREALIFDATIEALPLQLIQPLIDEQATATLPLTEFRPELVNANLKGSMPWDAPATIAADGALSAEASFFQAPLSLASQLGIAGEALTFAETRLDWADISLRAAGKVDAEQMDVQVNELTVPLNTALALADALALELPQVDALVAEPQILQCAAAAKAMAAAETDAAGSIQARRARLGDLGRLKLEQLTASGPFVTPVVAGDLTLSLCPEGRPAKLIASVKADLGARQMIEIASSRLDYRGSKSAVSGWVALGDGTLEVDASVNDFDLDIVRPFLPEATVAQLAKLSARVNLEAEAAGKMTDPAFDIDLDVKGLFDTLDYSVALDAKRRKDLVTISGLRVEVGPGRGAEARLADKDEKPDREDGENDDSLSELPPRAVAALRGTVQADLNALRGSGRIRGLRTDLDLDLTDVDLRLLTLAGLELPPEASGMLNGGLEIGLKPEKLQTAGRFTFVQAAPYLDELLKERRKLRTNRLADLDLSEAAKAEIDAGWSTTEEQLELKVDFVSEALQKLQEADPRTDIQKPLQLALTANLTPYRERLYAMLSGSEATKTAPWPLDLQVKSTSQLGFVNVFLNDPLQTIRGNLQLDLDVQGTTESPRGEGFLALQNGFYEQKTYGTELRNIELRLGLNGSRINIEKGDIDVAGDGHIGLAGNADWQARTVDVNVNLKDANLLRQPGLSATISGDLSAEGDAEKLAVTGRLEARPMKILLDNALKSSIPTIDVTVVDSASPNRKVGQKPSGGLAGAGTTPADGESADSAMPIIPLDIIIDAPQQVFLKGRGLDAELQGKIRVVGTASNPIYSGELGIKRGHMDLFNKRFELVRGQVSFANDAVALVITGEYADDTYTYQAQVSGTTADLKIELSSVPTLPQDEIISRILFGKSIQSITPIQAVQLASAVRSLQGGGGGFDPLGSAQQLLGVDSLTVGTQETDEGKGVNVGVGKYISDKVYLELERTPEVNQPWKGSVEIELRPNISLETSTGGQSGFGGVELKWKKDY